MLSVDTGSSSMDSAGTDRRHPGNGKTRKSA